MNSGTKKEKEKRTYEAPAVRAIGLVAEEVLGTGCKLASGGSGPMASPCTAGFCAGAGS